MAKKAQDDRVFIQNAVKTLATNIRFASVDNPVRSIVVTSFIPNEGKTTIATNLAQALASGGKTVLIVECDMRRRSLAAALGTHARNGIYAVLSGQVDLDDAVVRTSTRMVLLGGFGLSLLLVWEGAPRAISLPVKFYSLTFGNTRNGLFEGFFYIALGMYFGMNLESVQKVDVRAIAAAITV